MYRTNDVHLNKSKMTRTTCDESADAVRPTLKLQAEPLEDRIAPAMLPGPANLSPQNAILPAGYLKY